MDDAERDRRLKDAVQAHGVAMDTFCETLSVLQSLNPAALRPEAARRALDVIRALQQISDILDEQPLEAVRSHNDVQSEAVFILAITMLMNTVTASAASGHERPFRHTLATSFSNEMIRDLKAARDAGGSEYDA